MAEHRTTAPEDDAGRRAEPHTGATGSTGVPSARPSQLRATSWMPLVLFLLACGPFRDYVTDDAYIHATYARNLAVRAELAFNPGEPSYAMTSPLWVMAAAAAARGLGVEPIVACRLLSLVAGALSILVVGRWARRALGPGPWALAVMVAWAGDAWLVRWSSSGMESALAAAGVALLLGTLANPVSGDRGGGRQPDRWAHVGLGAVAALLCLVRPECYLLLALVAGWAFVTSRSPATLAAFAGGAALVLVPWIVTTSLTLGGWLPSTVGSKQPGGFADPAGVVRGVTRVATLLGATGGLAVLGIALGLRRPDYRRWLADPRGGALPLAWLVALPAGYVARDIHVLSRYLLPVTPALLVLGAAGAACALRRSRWIPAALCALYLVQSQAVSLALNLPHAREFGRGIRECFVPMAEFLREETPPGSLVAAPDIGVVGYLGERPILDLGGLVHPELAAIWQRVGYETMLRELRYLDVARPDYLIDRATVPDRLAGAHARGLRYVPVWRGTVGSLGVNVAGPHHYVVYRLDVVDDAPDTAR